MPAQTIHEAATTTGWSPRMLRYVEQLGLVSSPRSAVGYRLYGPAQLHRLRTLRELLERHGLDLGDVGLALRLRREPGLAAALDDWFAGDPHDADPRDADPHDADPHDPHPADSAGPVPPVEPGDDPSADVHWLRFEQDRHQQLLQHVPGTPVSPSAQTGTP